MGKKILLVEDEDDLRSLVAFELAKLGYEVHQAKDGEEGFLMAEKVCPDVILSDAIMPKKSGNELFKELRKTAFGKNIPFIILSARVRMKDYFEDMKVTAFIEKPFKITSLVDAIENALGAAQKVSKAQSSQDCVEPDSPRRRRSIKAEEIIASAAEDFVDKNLSSGEDVGLRRENSNELVKK